MASGLTLRIRYLGEEAGRTEISFESSEISLLTLLKKAKLAYAKTENGELVYAGRSALVEEKFLIDGSILIGPRKKEYMTMHELLALPTNNGEAHTESRMANTKSTLVNTFPKSLRPVQLKEKVIDFMARQPPTGEEFEPPHLHRRRHAPVESEQQLQQDVFDNAYTFVNAVLQHRNKNKNTRGQWVVSSNLVVGGRHSTGEKAQQKRKARGKKLTRKSRTDIEFKIPNTNLKEGGTEVKCFWILHEGRTAVESESSELERSDRSLLITPSADPLVDIIEEFDRGDDTHPVRKAVGQIHTYAKAGGWPVSLLTCDGFMWALIMDPDHPDDPFLSEHFKSSATEEGTQMQLILYTSDVCSGSELPPTFPDAAPVVVQVPHVQVPDQTRRVTRASSASMEGGASGPGTDLDRSAGGTSQPNRDGNQSGGREGTQGAGATEPSEGGVRGKTTAKNASEKAFTSASDKASKSRFEKASDNASQKASETPSDNTSERASDSATEKASGNSSDNASEQPFESASERVSDNQTEKAFEIPSDITSDEPSKSASERASDNVTAKPSENAFEKPSDPAFKKSSGNASAKPSNNAFEKPSGNASAKPSDPAFEEPSGNASAKPSNNSSAKPSGNAFAKLSDPAFEEPSGNASAKPSNNSCEKPSGNAFAKPSNNAFEKPSGNASAKPSDPAFEEPSGNASAKPSNNSCEKPSGNASAKLSDPAFEEPSGNASAKPSDPAFEEPSGNASAKPSNNAFERASERRGGEHGTSARLELSEDGGGRQSIPAKTEASERWMPGQNVTATKTQESERSGGREIITVEPTGFEERGGANTTTEALEREGGAEDIEAEATSSCPLYPARTEGLEGGLSRGEVWLTECIADGYAGAVYRGRLDGASVVVKTLDMARSLDDLSVFLNEVTVLKDLSSLWGVKIPHLLAYGPYSDSMYGVVLEEIPGRTLTSADRRYLRSAKGALRAVHRRKYKHGDIRLENFIVDTAGRVWLIDFGFSEQSSDQEACRREIVQLCSLFDQRP